MAGSRIPSLDDYRLRGELPERHALRTRITFLRILTTTAIPLATIKRDPQFADVEWSGFRARYRNCAL